MLTGEQIERLEALLAKATPGPWLYRCKSNSWHRPPPAGTQYQYGESIMDPEDDWISLKNDDIELIAEAINALPALLQLARAVQRAPVVTITNVPRQNLAYVESDAAVFDDTSEGQTVALVPVKGGA
jgi:hypothetical protein